MIQEVIDQSFKKDWNSCAQHPMQSWEWGEARTSMGLKILRLAEYSGKKLQRVYLMTIHRIPSTPFSLGYIPRSTMPSPEALAFLRLYGKQHNLIYIKFEPNEGAGEVRNHGLRTSPTALFPQWTQCIDLTKSEDELLKNMKQKTRYNIRLAEKKGVTVREMTTEEGFEIFIKLYFATTKRQHYAGHDYNYHHTIFQALRDTQSHILIAFFKETPIAAYHLFQFGGTFYYPYGGSSEEYREVMGANLLMWEAIKLGKKLGCRSFDLWGSLPPTYDEANIWAGFTRFKSGFGTEFIQKSESLDLVCNQVLYHPFILVQKLREKLLG